jgi:hypothetical protein
LWHSKKRNTLYKWKKSTIDARRSIKIYLSIFLSLYPKISVIASGATPIGSAGRAADDIYPWVLKQRRWKNNQKALLLPLGGTFLSI